MSCFSPSDIQQLSQTYSFYAYLLWALLGSYSIYAISFTEAFSCWIVNSLDSWRKPLLYECNECVCNECQCNECECSLVSLLFLPTNRERVGFVFKQRTEKSVNNAGMAIMCIIWLYGPHFIPLPPHHQTHEASKQRTFQRRWRRPTNGVGFVLARHWQKWVQFPVFVNCFQLIAHCCKKCTYFVR